MSQPPYPAQPPSGDPSPGYQNPGYPNPDYQQPAYPNPGYQQPGGQYPGYQNAPPPPTGYGVGAGMPPSPPGWGAQPPPPPHAMARPTTVTYALVALVVNMVLGVVAAVLIFANQDAYLDQALRDAGLDPTSAGTSGFVSGAYTAGAIVGLVFVGLWAMFLWFAWKGHNWARIVIWVFGGLSVISVFTSFGSPIGTVIVLNVVSLLLTLAAVVLLALKPSNEWYAYQGHARKYGWPGRA